MALLGIGIIAALVAVLLTIGRSFALGKWTLEGPIEEAMEFAGYSISPHPVYPWNAVLWLSAVLVLSSAVLFFALDAIWTSFVILLVGIALFFIYDLKGASVRTEAYVLPDGLYFAATRGKARPFFLPFADIDRVLSRDNGFLIEIKRLKACNRLPFKSRKPQDLLKKIEKGLGGEKD